MAVRHTPQSGESLKLDGPIHFHGPKTGDYDRMIVWSLGSTETTPAALASRAIIEALKGMDDHSSAEPESLPGAIRLDLGRTTHEDAVAKAITGHEALIRTQGVLALEQRGVGVSTKVMSFPDKE